MVPGCDDQGMEYGMFTYPVQDDHRSLYQELVQVNRTLEQKVQELNRAQQRLMEYRKVFECTRDLIYVFDRDYRYVMANEAYRECRKSRFPDLIGRTLPEVVGEETFARIKPHIDACLAGSELSFEDSHDYLDKGMRDLLVTFSPVYDGDRVERVACLIKDVSERKLLEEQLRQSQKMEAIGTLAGGIAHDFNNILTVIAGYASLIQINGEESEAAAMAGEIVLSVERAAEMTRSLLAFSRKQEVHLDTVDLNLVVAELHKSLTRLISEEVELVVRVAGEELYCLVDRGQLEQVLINLAVNARDAMPRGGVLAISTGVAEPEGEGMPAGRCAVITVSDNGTGMETEVQERVFEPFFTTKDVGKGTGLGLSSSYGIIKKHNGTIRMQSEPGAGTSFSIYLPLSVERPAGERRDAEERPGAGSGTVLPRRGRGDGAQHDPAAPGTARLPGAHRVQRPGGAGAVQAGPGERAAPFERRDHAAHERQGALRTGAPAGAGGSRHLHERLSRRRHVREGDLRRRRLPAEAGQAGRTPGDAAAGPEHMMHPSPAGMSGGSSISIRTLISFH